MAQGIDAEVTVRRLSRTVFTSVAFGMVALYAAFTASPLVAEDITGTRTWSGLPTAAAILGTSAGTATLSALMSQSGRRPGLALGWILGAAGAVAALTATQAGSFPLLVVGMLFVGIGHGANQLARFAAADPYPLERRGTMLSLVVWAGTIGAVVGPNLLTPSGLVVSRIGLVPLNGGYFTAGIAFAAAAILTAIRLRPDPATLAVVPVVSSHGGGGWGRTTSVAVAALVAAQFVMLLIMTMTPVHIRGHDHGLTVVGVIMAAHYAGMFGLAPLAGRASDRYGALRVALTGLLLAALAGVLAAVAPANSTMLLGIALLVLGLGWCAAFVASSTLLSRAGVTIQGRADSLGWAVAAVASVTSGMLMAWVGYAILCTIGIVIALIAAFAVLREMRRPVPAVTV